MGFQVGGVDHQGGPGIILWLGQFFKDAFEHTAFRPSPEAIVQGFTRAIFSGCIHPFQPVLDYVDNPAQNFTIINPTNAAFFGKERLDAFNLLHGEPKQMRHEQSSLPL